MWYEFCEANASHRRYKCNELTNNDFSENGNNNNVNINLWRDYARQRIDLFETRLKPILNNNNNNNGNNNLYLNLAFKRNEIGVMNRDFRELLFKQIQNF